MNVLIDVGHPAHVHYFKNFARILISHNHKVLFTCREKEVTLSLLKSYGFNYISLGKPYKSTLGKVWGIFWFTFRILIISIKFRPNILLNATHYSAIASWLLRRTHISIEDSFNMEQVKLYMPFTDAVLTSTYPHPDLGEKDFRYAGYQELLYLHPNYYTPDDSIFKLLGLSEGERYVILRFVSWNASHDIGQKGMSKEFSISLINSIEPFAKVFITSEKNLPGEFEKYKIKIPPERMHDALNYATIFVGEGTTMASECAVLGTPAIYVNSIERPYTTEQEIVYGLVYNFRNEKGVIEKTEELLKNENLKADCAAKKQKLLNDKIDVTAFLVWFVENWPESKKIMKSNPDYQYNFR